MAEEHDRSLAWRVGGPQGSGVDTAARLFGGACVAGGLHVFGRREYYSNIMGRHSYYDVRVDRRPMSCHRNQVEMLVTFDAETLARHSVSTVPGGAIIYDEDAADEPLRRITFLDERAQEDLAAYLAASDLPPTTAGALEDARRRGVETVSVSYDRIIDRLAQDERYRAKADLTKNTIAVAISAALLGFDPRFLEVSLATVFADKKGVVELNVRAVELAYDYVREELPVQALAHQLVAPRSTLPPRSGEDGEEMILAGGNEAVALGKMAAGMTFQTYYPISPATDESFYLEAHANVPQKDGSTAAIVIVQTEDEISAVTMAAGAALTGARSATATAGPGFSLMVEGMGWAGMNEVPLVITLYQRGGPSTGLPTRTEQSDLLFAINAGHGEFPRLVIASGDLTEAFYDAARAFDYAERYQTPVIHLLDQTIARTTQTVPPFDLSRIQIQRGLIYQPATGEGDGEEPYQRFALTESGVSPRALVGQPGGTHWLTGSEHTEDGLVTEDPVVRERQMEKRARKLELAAREIPLEQKLQVYGDPDAALTMVSWGSNKGAILEALAGLEADGIPARLIQVHLLWPFPARELDALLEGAGTIVVVESNNSGQFAQLLSGQTCRYVDHLVAKYNGRPMTCGEVSRALREIYQGTAERRIVLRNPYE
ncbi:MAG: 2-oxoacid:acceptor oxidoreductase subunit alpha [Anaerolineaceae bacterium]|nr:2-oxoacid:acceptor oxidoreductase subunit alpha [Anaerolineaceae bacterium]